VFRLGGAVVLVVAALAAGCGGGDDESSSSATKEWADGVCSALASWGDSIRSVTGTVAGDGSSEERVKEATGEVKEATDTLADDLQGLGRPDTESGQKAQDALVELAADLRQDLTKIEGAADSDDVVAAASTVTSTLSTMSSQIGSVLDELEQLDAQGELSDAFEASDACQDLANSTS